MYAHYETGNYVRSDVCLDDKEYGKALDTIVKGLPPQHVYRKMKLSVDTFNNRIFFHAGCVDIVLTDDGLGKVSPV